MNVNDLALTMMFTTLVGIGLLTARFHKNEAIQDFGKVIVFLFGGVLLITWGLYGFQLIAERILN